ncbi:MAG: GDSL-type esterase/lipase family protein [candidate division SR1 bacterium]|nr:GDSL-type esterase/lipase family protein [candidate division SR1 bacterium]
MAETKETIKIDIEAKNKELAILTAKTLADLTEAEKIKKDKLTEEIKVLQEQSDALKEVEKTTTSDQTNKETKALKDQVEIDSDQTYELMKDSKMHTKLLTVLGTEDKVEAFALDIDKVVRKFIDQELDGFSNKIKNSMSVGIQFAMMETLIEQGADGSAEFFTAFSGTKTASGTSAFEGLYKAFGKLGSANKFFILANKVQNITWYLSDKKNTIIASENIPELMNPVKFKTLLNKPVWSTQAQIDKLDITTILSLDTSTGVELSTEDKAALKKIVDNDAVSGVITKKTITAIQNSLITADNLLDMRVKVKTKASDLMNTIAGVLDINIPFFGNFGEMIGMKFPADILGEKKDGGVLNFVLGILGFRGGLNGLHKEYIKEKLADLKINNTFITAAYAAFQKDKDTTITNESTTGTWTTCALTAPDTTTETTIKAKIPADYVGLKKSIVDILSTATLNPIMVAKFAPGLVTTENDKSTIDMTQITGKEDIFVDEYLKYIIPLLADSTDDFITSKNIDQNSFALAVIGGLIGDKYFIEGVNIGLLSVTDFKDSTIAEIPAKASYEDIDETDPELVKLTTVPAPNESYSANTTFVKYLHMLEAKKGLAYGIMLNLMNQESGGQLYKKDGTTIIGSTAGAHGLFEFMPDTAKLYITKIQKDDATYYTADDYEKIYTNPIIGAKACAQFLKDRLDAGDDTVNILAHYNRGHSGTKITADNFSILPAETQNYIVAIGTAMLTYSGKNIILTTTEKATPSSISTTTLKSFFTAVNTILPPEKTLLPEVVTDVKIKAKTMADVTGFGDSGMEGLYLAGLKNAIYHRGYNTKSLLAELSNVDQLTKLQKYTSCIIITGYNDIAMKYSNATTKAALEAIITKLKPTQAVLSTLTYCKDKTSLSDAEVDRVNAVIRAVALEQKCPLIDQFKTIKTTDLTYQADGMHLTDYSPIFDTITAQVALDNTPTTIA